MDYQKIILLGNATKDARRNKSKKGDVPYTTFSLGVGDGRGNTTFFPVVVFGNYADAAAGTVKKGRMVLVEGRVDMNKQGRINVIADNIRLGSLAKGITPAKKE
jgi:single-stranded DNA-binding protein